MNRQKKIGLAVAALLVVVLLFALLFGGGSSVPKASELRPPEGPSASASPALVVVDDQGVERPDHSGVIEEEEIIEEVEEVEDVEEVEEVEETVVDPWGGLGDLLDEAPVSVTPGADEDEGPQWTEPECRVYLYKHDGFKDELGILKNGFHARIDETGLAGVSSIRIEGDLGCKVHLFKDPEGRSNQDNYTLKTSDKYPFVANLKHAGRDQERSDTVNLNDKVKAVRIWADKHTDDDRLRAALDESSCEVTLFDDKSFSGTSVAKSFMGAGGEIGDVHDLDSEGKFDDNTESLYLRGKGCSLKMFERHGFDTSDRNNVVSVQSGQNEAYVRFDGEMVYNGVRYDDDDAVRGNKMGSYRVSKWFSK